MTARLAVRVVPAPGEPAREPFDREAWEERAAIAEFDGQLPREQAEQLAWAEDDRRRAQSAHRPAANDPAPLAVELANRAHLDLDAMLEGQLTEPQWDAWGNAVAAMAARLDDDGKARLAALIEEIDTRWVANRAQETRQ